MTCRLSALTTSFGTLHVLESDAGLLAIGLPNLQKAHLVEWARGEPVSEVAAPSPPVRSQLLEYCAGRRRTFTVPLLPRGTPFQVEVWRALAAIPYGTTCSYADIARAIGRPQSTRAVGAAIGRNPLPIVLPCHRVIGKSGQLTGFGGGLELKRMLLDLENPPKLFAR